MIKSMGDFDFTSEHKNPEFTPQILWFFPRQLIQCHGKRMPHTNSRTEQKSVLLQRVREPEKLCQCPYLDIISLASLLGGESGESSLQVLVVNLLNPQLHVVLALTFKLLGFPQQKCWVHIRKKLLESFDAFLRDAGSICRKYIQST